MDSLGLFSGQSLQALSALLSPQEEHRKDECQVRVESCCGSLTLVLLNCVVESFS